MSSASKSKLRLPECGSCHSDSAQDQVAITENGFDGFKCQNCHLIYIAPKPDPSDVANLYDHDSAHVSADEWIAASRSFGKKLKARFTLRKIRSHRSSGDLLEIGAGGGAFLRQAAKYFRVFAAEFNPEQVKHLRSMKVDCRQGPFASTFQGMTFDVIYLCDVLSHLTDPVAEFRSMRQMLKPGGVIVFETGNVGDVAPRYYKLFDRWQYPDHLFFFSQRSLANLEEAAGLRRVQSFEFSRVLELKLDRRLKSAKSSVKSVNEKGDKGSSGGAKGLLKKVAMNLKHTVDFFLIYYIGRWLPLNERPQTVIVVLRA